MEFLRIAHRYLAACGIRIPYSFFRERLETHPDYPSLFSLTGTLDELGLAYRALRVEKDRLAELDFPLLAHTRHNGQEGFEILHSAGSPAHRQDQFLERWDGIVLMVKPGQPVVHPGYDQVHKAQKRFRRRAAALSAGIVLAGMLAFTNGFNAPALLFALLSAAGMGLSAAIVLRTVGQDNAVADRLCHADGTGGCDEVLQSRGGRLGPDTSLGDAGLVYFTGTLLFVLLAVLTGNARGSLSLLLVPAALSLPFTLFSLWYQWRVVGKWCRMCLLVVGILWLQAIVVVVPLTEGSGAASLPSLPGLPVLGLLLVCFMLAGCWLLVKPFMPGGGKEARKATQLLRWKRDPTVFLSLLYGQRRTDVTPWPEDIRFGNPAGPVQVLAVCNPYCSPCAATHAQLDGLLAHYPEALGLTVRFSVDAADGRGRRTRAVTSMLSHFLAHPDPEWAGGDAGGRQGAHPSAGSRALADWFAWMDLDRWEKQYPAGPAGAAGLPGLLNRHQQWCDAAGITSTPTLFVNGYLFPGLYEAADLADLMAALPDHMALLAATEKTA